MVSNRIIKIVFVIVAGMVILSMVVSLFPAGFSGR